MLVPLLSDIHGMLHCLDQPALEVSKPFDGNSATGGNGVMVTMQIGFKEFAPGQRGEGFMRSVAAIWMAASPANDVVFA